MFSYVDRYKAKLLIKLPTQISDRDGSLSVFSTATAHTYKEQSQQGGNDTATGPAPVSAQPTAKNNSPVVVSHTPEKHFAHSRSEDENPSREQTSIAASAAPRRRLQNKKQRRFFSKSYSGVRKLSSTKKALNIYNNNRRHNYVAALQALATTKEVRDLIEVSTEAPSSSSPMLDPAPQADVRLADDAKVVPHVQRWCDPIQDHSTGVKDLELHFRGLSVADPVDALAEQFSALCITPSDPVDAIFEDFWGLSITGRRSWCSEASKAEKPVWSDCLAPKFEIEDVEMSGLDPEDETNSRRLPQRPSEGFLRDVMTDGTEETKVVLHTWWSPTLIAPGQDVTMGGT
ncbi:uncharacterized protein KY384_004240 [Bacidia gigantensis]|uniref:uncharacterized protein n=1 Tax=Bacidia gigantensis TaxID=2732470 RepID=UPI001D04BC5D|nr:uncharacterized protein KY384_004240 [Bacidia gigantensis]KAG8530883.1 hypothetical protein KY384_004240 [Bacidia gigantensis]